MNLKTPFLILFVMCSLAFQPCFAQDEEISDAEFELLMEEFKTEFRTIVKDFPNNFENIKGAKVPDKSQYKCLVPLSLANETYLSPRIFTDEISFVSAFGEFQDEDIAKEIYEVVVFLVESTDFEFYLISDVVDEGSEAMTFWFVLDMNGDTYRNMAIKVRRFSVPTFNSDPDQPSKTFHVVLNIERIKS